MDGSLLEALRRPVVRREAGDLLRQSGVQVKRLAWAAHPLSHVGEQSASYSPRPRALPAAVCPSWQRPAEAGSARWSTPLPLHRRQLADHSPAQRLSPHALHDRYRSNARRKELTVGLSTRSGSMIKTTPHTISMEGSHAPIDFSGRARSRRGLASTPRSIARRPCFLPEAAPVISSPRPRFRQAPPGGPAGGSETQLVRAFQNLLRPPIEPQRPPRAVNESYAKRQAVEGARYHVDTEIGGTNRICKRSARSICGASRRMWRRLSLLNMRPSSQSAASNLRHAAFGGGNSGLSPKVQMPEESAGPFAAQQLGARSRRSAAEECSRTRSSENGR